MSITRHGRNPGTPGTGLDRASQVVVHNGTVYFVVTGNRPFGGTAAEQAQQCLAKAEERLATAGSSKSKLLTVQIWLSDMRYFQEVNAVYDPWLDQANLPVRCCAAVELGHPDLKVEIIITAAL
jgi:enamine deaminase RidA (YjgF/YER057c/UK114 family)